MEPRNRCQGINSASLCSLAGRYDNPIPSQCLAPIEFLKIPAQSIELFTEEQAFPPLHDLPDFCPHPPSDSNLVRRHKNGGFIKGILRGVRCTKLLRVLFLHRRPPSWTTLVLYSRAVFIFNEPA
jgi:hypothetical protein